MGGLIARGDYEYEDEDGDGKKSSEVMRQRVDIPCPLRGGATARPESPALVSAAGTISIHELDARVRERTAALRDQGVAPGDRVALLGRPDAEYVITFLALLRLGTVACPMNPRFPDAYRDELLGRICAQALPPLGAAWAAAATVNEPPRFRADQPATIIFTSGSAGPPKAALHCFGNHIHSALLSNRNLPIAHGDRWLLSLPMCHVAGVGVVFRCLVGGAAIVVSENEEPIEASVTRYGVTHLSLVATQLHRLLATDAGRVCLRQARAVLLGGGAIPEGLLRESFALGAPIFTSYGLTETASQVATTPPGDPLERLLTSGAPLDPGSLRIAADGEIFVRGKTLFLGYVEGDAVRRPLTDDGWFATGDLGYLDADGYLHVTGRRDNMFIAGGENIQPEEIEQVLCRCPGVREAVVVPVPHAEFGATPVAFVRCDDDRAPDEAALRRELETRLPLFKTPRRFLPWPEDLIPPGIKPDRKAFTARARGIGLRRGDGKPR